MADPDPPPPDPEPAPDAAAEVERFGPLDVDRHVKDDGRALIRYAWHRSTDDRE